MTSHRRKRYRRARAPGTQTAITGTVVIAFFIFICCCGLWAIGKMFGGS